MAKGFDVVDVWVGRFPSAEAADAYFDETYNDGICLARQAGMSKGC